MIFMSRKYDKGDCFTGEKYFENYSMLCKDIIEKRSNLELEEEDNAIALLSK